VNTPEGFAYYSIDPEGYAEKAQALAGAKSTAIVGIRSAGIALAALCAATAYGTRTTVRPTGHPYNRHVALSQDQLAWVQQAIRNDSVFLIVDEGPGLSGSSFLATAEALERAGATRARIHLLGSSHCDPERLVAHDATPRWRRFQFHQIPPAAKPNGLCHFKDHDWRSEFIPKREWPSSWRQLTPATYISKSGDAVWKFEGLGTHGQLAFARAQALADAGFMPEIVGRDRGLVGYRFVPGTHLRRHDLNTEVLNHLARYLAFRKANFQSHPHDSQELTRAVIYNVKQFLHVDLGAFDLPISHSVICDARMMPPEWLRSENGLFKLDSVAHGDSHFFPGACDIAWDVAGTMFERQMNAEIVANFLDSYKRASGDFAIEERLPFYHVAYAAHHTAFARMARSSITGEAEKKRFGADEQRYLDGLRTAISALEREHRASA
jgi:adenine/guanine phosphoribosyltransferase-like PRPP-binding protein